MAAARGPRAPAHKPVVLPAASSVLLLLLLVLSLGRSTHASGSSSSDDGGAASTEHRAQQHQPDAVSRAVQLRDKPGASARDQKQAAALLREAAGLVSTSSSSTTSAAVTPLPGFPDLGLLQAAAGGSSSSSRAALRELAKSYQRGVGVEVDHRLSLELFRAAASAGDGEAQGALGWRMAVGLHHPGSFDGASIRQFGPPDEAGALLHLYFGAAANDSLSQAALGYRHAYGIGVPKSCWSAVAYYKPVAEAVVAEAVAGARVLGPLGSASGRGLPQVERIRLNVHANQGIKPDRHREVLQYYQYSADRGNVDAQTAVGTLLNMGTHGVTRDHAAAAHYLQRAADAGSGEAMAHLGHMYGAGLGVPQDTAAALKWFRKAAGKQSPLGLYGLGYCYLSGTGVEQDYESAFRYLTAASEAGDRDAHFYLGAMHMHGLGMRRKSLNKAVMHFFQAASLGHIQAQLNVALMHLGGRGTPRACKPALTNLKALAEKGPLAAALQAGHEAFFRGHHNQALLSYLTASELGIEVAQSNAAWMLERGFGHTGHLAASVAASLYRRSAEQGNTLSLLQLGDAFYYGSGVEQDLVRAAAIYYEAYKGGSAEAMFNLGFLHQYGAGVPRDAALARRFYNMAKHTNADAALPVYLARAWLAAHGAWEWLRPRVPHAAARALDRWVFEPTPAQFMSGATSAAAAAAAQRASDGSGGQLGQLPPGGSDASSSSSSADAAAGGGQQQQQQRGWLSGALLPSAHGPLAWRWDGLVWRLTEVAGLAGLSISSIAQEYADLGETLLLLVLLAVLLLVLHIRRQRQTALQARVLAELAQPGQQQLRAQQLAAELGLQLPPEQQQPLLAAGRQPDSGGDGDGGAAAAAAGGGGGSSDDASGEQQQQAPGTDDPDAGGGGGGSSSSSAVAGRSRPDTTAAGEAEGVAGAREHCD